MELDSKIERIVKHVIDDVEHNYKDKHLRKEKFFKIDVYKLIKYKIKPLNFSVKITKFMPKKPPENDFAINCSHKKHINM